MGGSPGLFPLSSIIIIILIIIILIIIIIIIIITITLTIIIITRITAVVNNMRLSLHTNL